MARRRFREEEPHNHERWLVSYADFITLLFAFFVVMYSISQVNESKYRVFSNTLTDVFAKPALDTNPIEVGETARTNPSAMIEVQVDPVKAPSPQQTEEENAAQRKQADNLQKLSDKIRSALGDLIDKDLVTVKGNETWLEITLRSSLLFKSGDASISEDAFAMLAQIAAILREQDHPVRVEGFTDDVPIHNARFNSNWELSSARAAAVVQVMLAKGMNPENLVAAGFGQYQAIAPNTTEEGRAKNRRVVLMVANGGTLRPQLAPVGLDPKTGAMTEPEPEAPTPNR
ncbi:MAG: flagellar motor protein MotD [Spongiibacteraceae bacterium]